MTLSVSRSWFKFIAQNEFDKEDEVLNSNQLYDMFNIELGDKQQPQPLKQRKVYSGLRTDRDYTMGQNENLQRDSSNNNSKDKENLDANIYNHR